jgi:hypothetical protein
MCFSGRVLDFGLDQHDEDDTLHPAGLFFSSLLVSALLAVLLISNTKTIIF